MLLSKVTQNLGATSYGVIFEVNIKTQLSIILLSRPLGATRWYSSLHDYIYKVPAHYCIMSRPLGATLVEVFYEHKGNYKSQVAAKHDNPALGGYICGIFSFD